MQRRWPRWQTFGRLWAGRPHTPTTCTPSASRPMAHEDRVGLSRQKRESLGCAALAHAVFACAQMVVVGV
eukprot:5727882-Prymnesium_polylepis.1